MGKSDWPEGEPYFPIVYVSQGESDEDAIKCAKSHYSDSLECYIREIPTEELSMDVHKRAPLPTGAVIEYCEEQGVVIDDQGGAGWITVDLGDMHVRWRWHFDGVCCSVVSLPQA